MVKVVDKSLMDRELWITASPSTLLQLAFMLAPLALLLMITFQVSQFFQLTWVWSLATWTDVFTTGYYWSILLVTLKMAGLCVLLCFLISFPIAYGLATRFKAFENHIKVLMIFAFMTDIVLKTYGWVIVFDDSGVINWILRGTGIVGPDWTNGLVFSEFATMVGMIYNLIAFMIFTIYLSVLNIDRDLIQASYDCGASKFRTFWEVTLPLCRPGIWAGCVLVFVLSMGIYLEEKLMGGGNEPMMGHLIHQTFGTRVNWPLGSALTVVLMVAALVVLLIFIRLYRFDKYTATR